MKNVSVGFLAGIAVIALLMGGWYLFDTNTMKTTNPNAGHEEQSSEDTPVPVQHAPGASIGDENLVQFACADGKSMTAVFTRDILGLTLSDGRQMELRQAVSGSGIRYVNVGETIELRGKGNDAYLVEGGVTTFADCVAGT